MWISDPTPVISSTKAGDSGSSRSPRSTLSEPAANQSHNCRLWIRSAESALVTDRKIASPSTNERMTVAQPMMWPTRSSLRPPTSSTTAPMMGSSNRNPASVDTPVAGGTAFSGLINGAALFRSSAPSRWDVTGEFLAPSELQQVRVVDGGAPATTEDGHDDGQPDDDFGCGDDHHEESHHHTVEVALDPGEGHQGQIHRVEHQLDAHEDDDGVAPHQHSDGTAPEEQRGKNQE